MTLPADRHATAMGRALAQGLPPEFLAVLAAARGRWRAENEGRHIGSLDPQTAQVAGELWDEHLDQALEHPAAAAYDEVFVAAMRRVRRSR